MAAPGRRGSASLPLPQPRRHPAEPGGVWRSHLISRAAENQRFVLAANVADPRQHCPSAIISPRGEILAEPAATDRTALLRTTIDLADAATWYLGQRRRDIIRLQYRNRSDGHRFELE